MIYYVTGDIFDSDAKVLVNPVNTSGVMRSGLALEFKKRYPGLHESYKTVCKSKALQIGKLQLWCKDGVRILNFPTKAHWKEPSKLEYIEEGLKTFKKFYKSYCGENGSVAFPLLGCGEGRLDSSEVVALIEEYLQDLPINVYVYLER